MASFNFIESLAKPYVKSVVNYIEKNTEYFKAKVTNEGEYMAYEIFFDHYDDEAEKSMMISAKANDQVEQAIVFKEKVYNALIEGIMKESDRYRTASKSAVLADMITEDELCGYIKLKIKNYF